MPKEGTVRRLEIEWVGVKTVIGIMAEVTSQSSRIIVNSRRPYVGISCYSLCSAPVCLSGLWQCVRTIVFYEIVLRVK